MNLRHFTTKYFIFYIMHENVPIPARLLAEISNVRLLALHMRFERAANDTDLNHVVCGHSVR